VPSARERILAAAARLHAREGFAALSLRRVAREVGITPMAIYRHYPGKAALVEALVQAGFATWEARLARAARARTARRRIERALFSYADFALAEPRTFELMFLVPRAVPRAPDSLRNTTSPAFGAIIAAVHEVRKTARLLPGSPADVMLIAWAAAHGLIALHFSGRFGGDPRRFRQIYRKAVRQLIAALVA
jgi:AcrR family transcriptional regulator